MTFFSFYCFLQLYNFVPYYHGSNTFSGVVLCILFLFASLMTTLFIGFAVWVFARGLFVIDYFKLNCLKPYIYLSICLAAKFASGFLHAYIDDAFYRLLGLLLINFAILGVLVVLCRRSFEFKTYFSVYVYIHVGRVLLHLQLLIEISVPEVLIHLGVPVSENSLIIIITIFALLLLLNLASKLKVPFIKLISIIQTASKTRSPSTLQSTETRIVQSDNKGIASKKPKPTK